ncbi:hypothetical protein JZ751_026565 [Albula glossodonta]|uniref:Uncharacterized protein n=1 Tax=Albula glossodonta TaxID=121402 RepID=A0A8T2PKK3_9TELE|nr:hypothetical protein JZ751_026565 [Albula glossodonta]
MDQHQDLANSQGVHYNSGGTMAATMADMAIKENGVPSAHIVPGEGPMKAVFSIIQASGSASEFCPAPPL